MEFVWSQFPVIGNICVCFQNHGENLIHGANIPEQPGGLSLHRLWLQHHIPQDGKAASAPAPPPLLHHHTSHSHSRRLPSAVRGKTGIFFFLFTMDFFPNKTTSSKIPNGAFFKARAGKVTLSSWFFGKLEFSLDRPEGTDEWFVSHRCFLATAATFLTCI